jgi:hypothetical protein
VRRRPTWSVWPRAGGCPGHRPDPGHLRPLRPPARLREAARRAGRRDLAAAGGLGEGVRLRRQALPAGAIVPTGPAVGQTGGARGLGHVRWRLPPTGGGGCDRRALGARERLRQCQLRRSGLRPLLPRHVLRQRSATRASRAPPSRAASLALLVGDELRHGRLLQPRPPLFRLAPGRLMRRALLLTWVGAATSLAALVAFCSPAGALTVSESIERLRA